MWFQLDVAGAGAFASSGQDDGPADVGFTA
jgi:hypothetical protein